GDVSPDLSVAVADVNRDGKLDIIVANGRTDTVTVLLGYGDGTFQDSPGSLAQHTFAVAGPFSPGFVAPRDTPIAVAVADVNGDGRPDIITANYAANYGSHSVSVLLGNGDGTFHPGPFSSPGLPPGTFAVGSGPIVRAVATVPISVAVADVNGDGISDIITTNYGASS